MEILNIGDSKLKITLNKDECLSYGIDPSGSDFSGTEIRRAVRNILADIKDECGFSRDGDKILVQLYPLPDGRCELLIARLDLALPKDRRILSSADGVSVLEEKRGIYRFSSRRDLRGAVRAVYREGVDCDLYREGEDYYISVKEEFLRGFSEFEIFIEYGERMRSLPISAISEYGTLVARGNAFDFIMSEEFEQRE